MTFSDCFSRISKSILTWRSWIILLAFCAIGIHAVLRNVLNVSSVCMLKKKPIANVTSSSFLYSQNQIFLNDSTPNFDECVLTKQQEEEYDGNLDWKPKHLDYVQGALGWGRLAAVFPFGFLADRLSASKILFWSFAVGGISTALMPFAAFLGYQWMLVLRIIVGMTAGAMQPCITTLIAHWSPEKELSSRLIFVMSGLQLSVFVMNPIIAEYCRLKDWYGGWPIGFVSSGLIALLWCLAWRLLATNEPSKHTFISQDELNYISMNRKFTMQQNKDSNSLRNYPFKEIFFSKASLACLMSDLAGTFGVFCVLYYFPRYLKDVVVLDITTTGFLAGLPNLLQFICKLSFSALADYMKNRLKWNKTRVVKGFNTFGLVSLAVLLFSATFITCKQPALAVACIVLSKAFYAATGPGYIASELLIAPKYAGFTCGWFNLVATCGQIALPYLKVFIVTETKSAAQWRMVFGIGSAMQILAAILFLFWGSGEEQSWAKSDKEEHQSGIDHPRLELKDSDDSTKTPPEMINEQSVMKKENDRF